MNMRTTNLDIGVPETPVDSGTTQLFHIAPTGAMNPHYKCTHAKWAANTVLLKRLKVGEERLALVDGDEDQSEVVLIRSCSGSGYYEGLWARKSDIDRLRRRHIAMG